MSSGWQDASPHPWRRYFARMIDFSLWEIGMLFVAVLSAVVDSGGVIASNAVLFALVMTALSVPVQALLLGSTGTTIGKWIMGVRVTDRDGRGIGFVLALRREIHAWFSGMALGLPLLHLVASIFAYSTLRKQGATSWDKGQDWVVTHRPTGVVQFLLSVFGVVLILAIQLLVQQIKHLGE